jgi:hypothetical protein
MKKTLYILTGAALVLLTACENVEDVKSLEIERTSGIHKSEAWAEFIQGTNTVNTIGDEAYYQSLRDWKKAAFDENGITTRSISYIFFADYGSMAFRFADIPDSVDVINLWGGCPKKGSLDYQEMKACQEIKGMKVVGCRITRILENARWGMEAQIPSFMNAYEAYKYDNMGKILQGKITAQELESAALDAGNAALRADVQAHPGKGAAMLQEENPEWPEWCVYASQVLLDEIEQYGLDGYDLDYEPEGDPLSGTAFNTMVAYLSQFIGPKSGNEGTLLIIDRNSGVGDSSLAPLCNFWIYQKYGSTGGASPATQSDFPSNLDPEAGWVPAKVIVTENVGDTYSEGCHNLEQMANFQPSTVGQQYGHKGGFASFHGQRDWRLEAEGAEKGKTMRYQHHIMGIRAQSKVEYYK